MTERKTFKASDIYNPYTKKYVHQKILDIFDDKGLFAKNFENYVKREGQINFADMVLDTFVSNHLLIAEAGTGTGKTYAYLVPALIAGKKVVISTASKALQDQLISKDIPRLLKLMGLDKLKHAMVLKGFSNYLCRKKYIEALNLGLIIGKAATKLREFVESETAKMDEDNFECSYAEVHSRFPKRIVDFITMPSNECHPNLCEFCKQGICFAHEVRKRAQKVDLVVINHALFFSALSLEQKIPGGSFLPDYDAIIFDEAHALPDVGRSHFSKTFSVSDFADLQKSMTTYLSKTSGITYNIYRDLLLKINESLGNICHYFLTVNKGALVKKNILEYKYVNYDKIKAINELNQEFHALCSDLYLKLKALSTQLFQDREVDEDQIGFFHDEIVSLMDIIVSVLTVDKDKKGNVNTKAEVAWVETFKNGFAFTICPLDIGPQFGRSLDKRLSNYKSIVMTSATISVDNSFNKFMYDVGANLCTTDRVKNIIVPSIFDYAKNSLLYVSDSFPNTQDAHRISRIIESLDEVIKAVPGGIFFLTTSYSALEQASLYLNDRYGNSRKILTQQGDLSNNQLMQEFKENGYAILVGTSSFWEGVDVPGKALSLVIIDKLPFESPSDPLFEARSDFAQKKGLSPFMSIAVPEAVIALRQGVGRLIRQESDRGVMIICDPRLCTTHYGKIFLNSLPPMARASSQLDMLKFLKEG